MVSLTNNIPSGVVHEIPKDLKGAFAADPKARAFWKSLTPLARNEWICWTISVKRKRTRKQHIERVTAQLKEGKRRPCCWFGCIHRTDKAISPSVKYILDKRSSKR